MDAKRCLTEAWQEKIKKVMSGKKPGVISRSVSFPHTR